MQNFEVLFDEKKDGSVRPWKPKKVRSLVLADAYDRLGRTSLAQRVRFCGSELLFGQIGIDNKLISANFCRDRLCPLCMWRKSLKVFQQTSEVYDETKKRYPKYRPLFLTLSVRNCTAEELAETIDLLMKSWNRMTQNRRFKNRIKGYFRALEVTYNKITKEFHPHFHVILIVDELSYFSPEKDLYMNQKEWKELWKKSAKLDYEPVVDIRKVHGTNAQTVGEVAKYTLKDKSILSKTRPDKETDKIIYTLKTALASRRLYSFGGVMKEIAKELKQDELGEGDLIFIDGVINSELVECITVYKWNFQYCNYIKEKD